MTADQNLVRAKEARNFFLIADQLFYGVLYPFILSDGALALDDSNGDAVDEEYDIGSVLDPTRSDQELAHCKELVSLDVLKIDEPYGKLLATGAYILIDRDPREEVGLKYDLPPGTTLTVLA